MTDSLIRTFRTVTPLVLLSFCSVFAVKADVCGAVAGNAVANCGFETGDFSGWTLSGNLQGGAPPNNYYGVDNSNPNSGSYAAYIGVQGGGGTAIGTLGPFLALTQSLNLLPGEYYQVSFVLAQNTPDGSPGYVNHFDALLGGAPVFSETNAPFSGYQTYSFVTSTAGSASAAASTLLQFDFQNDGDYFYFDDVAVSALAPVPEPASALLLLPGAACLLWARSRRRS